MKKVLLPILLILLISAVLIWGYQFVSSVNTADPATLTAYISKQNNLSDVTVLKTAQQGDFYCALYSDGYSDQLIILKKSLLSGRYTAFGGGHISSGFGTYNYSESNTWTLIVVYGNNQALRAHSYAFLSGGKQYAKENLKEYVLDIYVIQNTEAISEKGILFDESGNEVGSF